MPRIYTYKITFEEVPYYYYGVHREKKFGEYYMGSPKTHRWCWEFYTPKKQILEIFPYTDEGWLEAQEVEKRLIKPFYNEDKQCLNKSCGGRISLKILRRTAQKNYELGIGIHGLSTEQRVENSRKNGQKTHELGIGVHGRSLEKMSEDGRKGGILSGKISGEKHKKNKTGIFGRSPEKMSEDGRKGGNKHKENKTGICGLSQEELSEAGKLGGKVTCSQKWQCTITGYVSNPGSLSSYQKARNIDTSNRIRIQ